jgi:chromosome segregation ATPase
VLDENDLLRDEVPPWVTNPTIMSPLLLAYDNRIKELESKQDQQINILDGLARQNDELQGENETLRKDLQHYMDKLISMTEGGKVVGGNRGSQLAASIVGVEEALDLQRQLDLLMEENNIISQQVHQLERVTEDLRHDSDRRDEHIQKLTGELKTASEALLSTQKDNLHLDEDKRRGDDTISHLVTEKAALQATLEERSVEIRKLKLVLQATESKYQDLEKSFKEFEAKAEFDQDEIFKKAHGASLRSKELMKLNSTLNSEMEKLKNQLRELSRDYDTARSDAQGMLKVMHGMEQQISDYVARDKATVDIQRQCAEKVEQALLERDQSVAREAQGKREIGRLMEQKKAQESTITYQVQDAVNEAKNKLNKHIGTLEDELVEVTKQLGEAQANYERALREKRSFETEFNKVNELVGGEKERLSRLIDGLAKRIEISEKERDEAVATEQRIKREWREHKSNHDEERERLIEANKHFDKTVADLEAEINARQNEFDKVSTSLANREGELSRLRSQFNDFRTLHEHEVDSLKQSLKSYTHTYKNHVADMERNIDDLKRELEETKDRHEREHTKLNMDFDSSKTQLHKLQHDAKEERSRLMQRNEELGARLAALLAEHADDTIAFGLLKETNDSLTAELDKIQYEHEKASSALASSLAREAEYVSSVKSAQLQCDRITLEVERVKKQRDNYQRQLFDAEQKLVTAASFSAPYNDYVESYSRKESGRRPLQEVGGAGNTDGYGVDDDLVRLHKDVKKKVNAASRGQDKGGGKGREAESKGEGSS